MVLCLLSISPDENVYQSAKPQKAAVRDLKAFRDANSMRQIPVGLFQPAYVYDPSRPGFERVIDWFVCGENPTDTIDFVAVWVGNYCFEDAPSLDESGYTNATNIIKDIPVPFFFTGDGCPQADKTWFWSPQVVFQPPMVDHWSGSVVEGWWNE